MPLMVVEPGEVEEHLYLVEPLPACSMTVNGDAVYTATTAVTIDSAVAGATGAIEMRFRNAGGSWSSR